jgi:hypothetical protein
MSRRLPKTVRKEERGMALLLSLFALLLLSGLGLFLMLSSNTETRIDANYGSGLRAYYAARSGLEEVRDRIRYASNSTSFAGGIADLLPQDVAGNTGGVLYIVNPAPGETVNPADVTSPYFDDDLCHLYNSGTPKGVKCATVPGINGWQLKPLPSKAVGQLGQLNYKWVRITMKTNRSVLPSFCVDQQPDCSTAPLDTRVCWDGQTEQLSPGGSCDANGMQTVYLLTAFAVNNAGAVGPNAAHKLLQVEVVAPSIRPAGVLTAASMNVTTSGTSVIPSVVIDGRAHDIGGVPVPKPSPGAPPPSNACSDIAALATDTGGAQLASALDTMRRNLVNTANASCSADGSGLNGNVCSPGLWWVRGTDSSPRFVTTVSTSGSNSGSDGGSSSGTSGGSGSDGGDHHGTSTLACNSTTPNCYTYLNLNSPQLFATSATSSPAITLPSGQHVPTVSTAGTSGPFMGGAGNQSDTTIYQPGGTQTVADQVAAVQSLVNASVNQQNYFTASSSTLAGTYGSYNPPNPPNPAVVKFLDATLSLQSGQSLTGYGVLVIPGALEINPGAYFNWTGIVLISSPGGHVTVSPGARGGINGALLLTPGAVFNTTTVPPTLSGGAPSFVISYSCEAIDMVFSMQPFKIISTAETSF